MSDTTAITEAQFAAALLRVTQAIEDYDYATAEMRIDAAWSILHGLMGSSGAGGVTAHRQQSLEALAKRLAESRARRAMNNRRRIVNIKTGRSDHGG